MDQLFENQQSSGGQMSNVDKTLPGGQNPGVFDILWRRLSTRGINELVNRNAMVLSCQNN